MGTYTSTTTNTTFDTLSVSNTYYITGDNASKIGVSQFPARLYTVGSGSETPDTPVVPDEPVTPPAEEGDATASLSLSDVANRTTSTESQQVWEENGVTLTYSKGSYNSGLAEYANPIRLYKNTEFTVAYPGMTKLVFNCATTSYQDYVTPLVTALQSMSGVTVEKNGEIVTVTFAAPTDSLTVSLTAGQVRVYSIDVYTN